MSDVTRNEEIVRRVRAVHPRAIIQAPDGWVYSPQEGWDGSSVRVYDTSLESIGGVARIGDVFWMDDRGNSEDVEIEELPAPTLKPRSWAVNTMRQIEGIDPMPKWSEL